MYYRITYCDVCECAECPKYGDDCDGDKRNDDLISRADAIEAVAEDLASALNVSKDETRELAEHALFALPSAEPSLKAIKRQIDKHWYLDPPSAEAKGDLISREEVLRMIITAGECEPDLGYTHLHKVIESLPSAEAVQGWIPCSERLPDTDISVLVSDGVYVWVDELQEDYEDGKNIYWWDSQCSFDFNDTAWMPLPTPYKGGDDK